MSSGQIAALVGIVGALLLALRGVRRSTGGGPSRLLMAAAWLVIIVGVVFLIETFGLERTP